VNPTQLDKHTFAELQKLVYERIGVCLNDGKETIDAITTNTTSFFREPKAKLLSTPYCPLYVNSTSWVSRIIVI